MVYGEDEVVTLVLVPLPISIQNTTKVNILDSKQRSAVFHVKVIVESVVVMVTSGGPGWAGGEGRRGDKCLEQHPAAYSTRQLYECSHAKCNAVDGLRK